MLGWTYTGMDVLEQGHAEMRTRDTGERSQTGTDMLNKDMVRWDMLACVGVDVRGHTAVLGREVCNPSAQPSSGNTMLPSLCRARGFCSLLHAYLSKFSPSSCVLLGITLSPAAYLCASSSRKAKEADTWIPPALQHSGIC